MTTKLDQIMQVAEKVAAELVQLRVDLGEAQKAGDYFRWQEYDERAMARYLDTLAEHPPPRSQRTKRQYQGIREVWSRWNTNLQRDDKARAWGWAVRLAKTGVFKPLAGAVRPSPPTPGGRPSFGKPPGRYAIAGSSPARPEPTTYASGRRVKCKLLAEKSKKGLWRAQILGTEITGHVLPGSEPPDLAPDKEVELEIHSCRPPSPAAFRWLKSE